MNRQDKIEGRLVVSPTQNWGATRRTEPTRSRNLQTAADATRHDFSPQFTSPGGCAEPLHLRSVLNPMVFPVPRSLGCPGRLEDARASASSNHSAVSSLDLDVSEVFAETSLGSLPPWESRRETSTNHCHRPPARNPALVASLPALQNAVGYRRGNLSPDPMAFELFAGVGTVFPVERENEFDAISATTPTIASWLEQQRVPASQARDYISRLFWGLRLALSKRPSAVSHHWPLLTPLPAA
jgi:hypothetical protein